MESENDVPQQSKMHRALLIPEILRLIIRQLHPIADTWSDSDLLLQSLSFHQVRKALYSLYSATLVSTLFSEHALDYLWWIMTDLRPLFRLLPAFKPAGDIVKVSLLDGIILPEDLHRFNSYARRIRAYHTNGKEKFHASTIFRILKECNRSYLLPTLQSLVVSGDTIVPITLISPGVRGFRAYRPISIKEAKRYYLEMYPCISDLPRTAQNLISLTIESNFSAESIKSIFELPHLQYLELNNDTISEHKFVEINLHSLLNSSSVPVLRDLRLLGWIKFTPLTSPLASSETITFPALERLETTPGGVTMDIINTFLSSTSLPRLKAFVCDINWPDGFCLPELSQWTDLFRILSQITTADFDSFKIKGYGFSDVWDGQQAPSVREVLGHSSLNLTNFEFVAPLFASISIVDLQHVARLWPNMRVLNLSQDPSPLAQLGLDVLLLLAHNLPHLQSLCMALPSERMCKVPVMNHGLRSLDLCALRAPLVRQFVRSVDKIFPCLEDWSFAADDEELQELWGEAADLLPFFQSVRKEHTERQMEYPNA